jgi:hypothetical protein
LSIGLVAVRVPDQVALSPFDEWVYSDYLDKVTRGDLPNQGERIDAYALELSSCRGVFIWGPQGTPCGEAPVAQDYPQAGITSADIHPPLYFVVTSQLARAILAVGPTEDLLTAGRLAGSMWLAGGLILIFLLAREWGSTIPAAGAMTLAVAVAPLTRYANSYVTPDAANLAVGAGVMLAASLWLRARISLTVLLVVGSIAGALKAQNLLVVGVAAMAILTVGHLGRGPVEPVPTMRRSWLAATALVGGALAAQGVWLAYRAATAVGQPPDQGYESTSLPLGLILQDTAAFVAKLGLGATEDGQPIPVYGHWLSWLLIGGLVGSVLILGLHDWLGLVAASTLIGLTLGGPILMVAIWALSGDAVPSPARYGMVLLPAAAAITAAVVREKWLSWTLLGLWSLVASWIMISHLMNL